MLEDCRPAMDQVMPHLGCSTISGMQIIVALLSLLAAVFWFISSRVKMPNTAFDEMPMADMGEISKAFGRQSAWNAAAAICAAAAAFLQAFLVYAPTCINLG